MSATDFHTDVIERSRSVPVVVDFWAPWCAPCRTLGPVLDELAAEADGRWELVKLNTEEQPEVARQYEIRGIPAVKMFHAGDVVAEFVGALATPEVRRWLDANLPEETRARIDGIMRDWPDAGPALEPSLQELLNEHPDTPLARLRLAQVVVANDPRRARDLVASAGDGSDLGELAAEITALADLMDFTEKPSARLAPHLESARRALREHDLDATLEHLIEAALTSNRFGDGLPGRAAASLSRLLGPEHELARKHRRRLAMALHA